MIHLVTAFSAETNPLIRHFQLKQTQLKPFRIFENQSIRLIVSGIGKDNSKKAVSFLHELFCPHPNPLPQGEGEVWINIGIAGHRDLPVGTGILAHKVEDEETQKSWYPQVLFEPSFPTGSFLTVEQPESHYLEGHVYDMEASGFYEAALQYSILELVHCYKVISDNSKSSHEKITPEFAEKIIANRLNEISFLVDELKKRVEQLRTLKIKPEELEPFLKRWHFTVTQTFQLRRLLRQFKTLTPSQNLLSELQTLPNSKKVVAALENKIREIPVTFNRHCEAHHKRSRSNL